ncbi:hypothetical protein ACFX19_038395 [Malus domestica]
MACSYLASLSCAKRHLMDSSAAEMYSLRGLPRHGGTRTGGVVRETLICVNASWCSARHSKVSESLSFKSVEKAFIFPAELAMNRQRKLILPSNDCSCFLVVEGGALMIARALFSSTSIPR